MDEKDVRMMFVLVRSFGDVGKDCASVLRGSCALMLFAEWVSFARIRPGLRFRSPSFWCSRCLTEAATLVVDYGGTCMAAPRSLSLRQWHAHPTPSRTTPPRPLIHPSTTTRARRSRVTIKTVCGPHFLCL